MLARHSQFDPVLVLCRAEKVIIVGAWMDALREWMESDLEVIMVGTWMLCGNGWSLIWTLSWLAHGCSAGVNIGSDPDVIMLGP